jgi:hypothetical protein
LEDEQWLRLAGGPDGARAGTTVVLARVQTAGCMTQPAGPRACSALGWVVGRGAVRRGMGRGKQRGVGRAPSACCCWQAGEEVELGRARRPVGG